MRRGLDAIDADLRGGPGESIAAALMELISLTSRPPSMDDAIAAAYMASMPKAMWDYPIDVVRNACTQWRRIPGQGRWWPTEQDLRAQCDELVRSRRNLRDAAQSLLNALQAEESAPRQRSVFPVGATKAYVREVGERLGHGFTFSWLSGRTCAFDERTVYTIALAQTRLTEATGALIEKHGVSVVTCLDVTKRFYEDEDVRAMTQAKKPKRRA